MLASKENSSVKITVCVPENIKIKEAPDVNIKKIIFTGNITQDKSIIFTYILSTGKKPYIGGINEEIIIPADISVETVMRKIINYTNINLFTYPCDNVPVIAEAFYDINIIEEDIPFTIKMKVSVNIINCENAIMKFGVKFDECKTLDLGKVHIKCEDIDYLSLEESITATSYSIFKKCIDIKELND